MGSSKKKIDIDNVLTNHLSVENRYIENYNELRRVVNELRKKKLRIVLTQGVYDLLHEGHARYLEKALTFGDVLIVGVDTDALTRARKGPSRPVVPFEERIHMLAHLRHVTFLTKRDVGDDIGELIRIVQPHVLVTSQSTKDFPQKDVVSYREFCEEIVTLPPQATTSTTARIRFFTIEGADKLARDLTKKIPKLVVRTLKSMSQS